MPLYRKDRQCGVPQRLDCAVVRPLYGVQACAEVVNALMMRTVDGEACAVKRAEERVIGARFVQTVSTVDLPVSVDVLVQRAAEGNIDDLQAAADAEDGGASRGERTREGKLVEVAYFVNIGCSGETLPVETRVDVAATREQQGIGCFGRIRCRKTEQSERGKVVWERL